MKIQKNSKRKSIIIIIAITAVALATYTSIAAMQNLWPFSDNIDKEKISTPNKSTSKENTPSDRNKATDTQDSTNNPNNPSQSNDDHEVDSSGKQPDTPSSYAPPLLDPPAVNDPYPIQNERYEIAQTGESNFRITLYPLEWDYDAQLREFKYDALNYLEKRYGSTRGLTIEWSPSHAENI